MNPNQAALAAVSRGVDLLGQHPGPISPADVDRLLNDTELLRLLSHTDPRIVAYVAATTVHLLGEPGKHLLGTLQIALAVFELSDDPVTEETIAADLHRRGLLGPPPDIPPTDNT